MPHPVAISSSVALALLALSAAGAAHAQTAAPLVTVNASLTGLQFELIDLDPADGIAPGITFHNPEWIVVDFASQTFPTATLGPAGQTLWPSPSASFVNDTGSLRASTTPDGIQVSSEITWEDMALPLERHIHGNWAEAWQRNSITLTPYTPDWPEGVRYTLAANTALKITGQASVSKTVDTASLDAWLIDNDFDGYTLQVSDPMMTSVGIYYNTFEFEPIVDLDTQFLMLQQGDWIIDQPGQAARMETAGAAFSLDITNTSSQAQEGWLVMGVLASAGVSLTVDTGTPAIPEPATYALMGLGLVGIGLAASRRRRAAH